MAIFKSTPQRPSAQAKTLIGCCPNSNLALTRITWLALSSLGWVGQASSQAQSVYQVNPDARSTSTDTITVRAERSAAPRTPSVSGLGDVPLRELPLSATVLDAQALQSAGVLRLADLTRLDASTTDSYNAVGYWDFLSVRGYTLDNRANYRREGLPISAETSIALDNKERIEVLKGASGMQAGTSSPGGLVNYVVKRPTAQDFKQLRVELSPRGGISTALDLGGRLGEDKRGGYRLNWAHETLRPDLDAAKGERSLISLALEQRIGHDGLLEAEVEATKRAQASQPGFSLLGNQLPAPSDPKINLNNQPWSQPVVMRGTTATVKYTQAINADWSWQALLGSQQLRTDDRLAYAYGCGAEGNYDRYCSNGTFDLYDYRSEGEKRHLHSGQWSVNGKFATGTVKHALNAGLLRSSTLERYGMQAYNGVGTGNVGGSTVVAADPSQTYAPTNRDERATELFVNDSAQWQNWRMTAGLRHSNLVRNSVRVDGTEPTGYRQSLTTPFAALSYQLNNALVYGSAGQGMESYVTPNKAGYTNPGQALTVAKSEQFELGMRSLSAANSPSDASVTANWSVAAFKIKRPAISDNGAAYQIDGAAEHQGLEAQASSHQGPWRFSSGAMLLHAERTGSSLNAALNGNKSVNVPDHTLRANVAYALSSLPGLEADLRLTREGERAVTADNSIMLAAWNRWDASLTYKTAVVGKASSLRVALENLTNQRYWRESPTQFGHIYLYPSATRTLRVSLLTNF
jgi:iron complex outermembrane recepter protein